MKLQTKNAFTLAEVLITLGVIGIVAAMTIPGLITQHQKAQTVAGIMEAQSILNQAVKMYTADTDEDGAGELDTKLSARAFAEKYFKPYLKIARICTQMQDGCWETGDFYGYYDIAGRKVTDTVPYSIVLNNGMILGFSKINGTNLISIVVDINGKSKRNVMGRDVFVFYTYNNENLCEGVTPEWKMVKNGIYPGSFNNCGAPHIVYTREQLLSQNVVLRSCNKNAPSNHSGGRTGAGSACAAVIFKDGWKISSDYPW